MRITYVIPDPRGLRIWPANEQQIAQLLGRKGSKWPDTGIPVTTLDCQRFTPDSVTYVKIMVWVGARYGNKPRSQHRVQCRCPGCSRVLSVGRLAQHRCTK